jgi:hypothetical protein
MFFALFGSQARADLIADIQGVAISGSGFAPNGGGFNDFSGQSFDVQAVFSISSQVSMSTGVASYVPSSVTATVGGTTYTLAKPGKNGVVGLTDPSNTSIGYYALAISADVTNLNADYLAPEFTKTTPAISATSPSATVFSGYASSLDSTFVLVTPSGTLSLIYSAEDGPTSASLTTVPEPTALIYFAEATLLGLGIVVYRRRAVVVA